MGLKFCLTDKELVFKDGNDVSYFKSVGKPPDRIQNAMICVV